MQIPAGGPRASPTQSRKSFLRTVGEGLKVNRPKAERSHPGVCSSREPDSVRPLRKEGTASVSAVGAAHRAARSYYWLGIETMRVGADVLIGPPPADCSGTSPFKTEKPLEPFSRFKGFSY